MADAATVAVSETISTPVSSPASSGNVLADLTDSQHETWLQTGDLPEASPAPVADAIAAADPVNLDTKESADRPLGKPRDDARARFSELTQQRNTEKVRADAAEKRAAELEARMNAPASTPSPVQSAPTGPRVFQTPDGKTIDFSSSDPDVIIDEFIKAGYKDPYAAMNFYTPQALMQFDRQEQAERSYRDSFVQSQDSALKATREAFPDFDPTPLQGINISATLARLIYEHPSASHLLKHFSEQPAEARMLAVRGDVAAALTIGELANRLTTQSAVVPSTPAAKTMSSAPASGTTLGRKPTGSVRDEVQDAIESGDYERFAALENAREYAALKAGR